MAMFGKREGNDKVSLKHCSGSLLPRKTTLPVVLDSALNSECSEFHIGIRESHLPPAVSSGLVIRLTSHREHAGLRSILHRGLSSAGAEAFREELHHNLGAPTVREAMR